MAHRALRHRDTAYRVVATVVGLVALARLVLAAAVALTRPGLGVPALQASLDGAAGVVALGLGLAVLRDRPATWPPRWVALSLLAFSGTSNLALRANEANDVLTDARGPLTVIARLVAGWRADAGLQAVALASLVLALSVLATGELTARGPVAATVAAAAGVGVCVAWPASTAYVVLDGVMLPLLGWLVLRARPAPGRSWGADTRLVSGALVAVTGVGAMLALVSAALWTVDANGRGVVDPTVAVHGGDDLALLYWYSRVVPLVVASSVLAASRRSQSMDAERRLGRALVVAVVAPVLGGGFVLLRAVGEGPAMDRLPYGQAGVTFFAAVPVALALYPVYLRAERWVDHLLYGRRPTPYSLLAGIGSLVRQGAPGTLDLHQIAEAVGRELGANRCRLTVDRPGLGPRSYEWRSPDTVVGEGLVEVPIPMGMQAIGRLAVDAPTAAALPGGRRALLDDVAGSLSAVLQANRLGIDLERHLRAVRAHAVDIAGSRRRLVAEMDAERRRVERDLHDGAQHHLVSLRLALGLVEHQLSQGQYADAAAALAEVGERIDETEAVLERTATGDAAPRLADVGLVVALREELGLAEAGPAIVLDVEGLAPEQRLPAEVEEAVWFCCTEAIGNARKHAPGATVTVTLRVADGRLRFRVQDDGPGWDGADGDPGGKGLGNVRTRAFAVGGHVDVRSAPGIGTTVDGDVPLGSALLPGPVNATGPEVTSPFAVEVDAVLRAAEELYSVGPEAQAVAAVRQGLAGRVRVGVLGEPAAGTTTLTRALALGCTRLELPVEVADLSEPLAPLAIPVALAIVLVPARSADETAGITAHPLLPASTDPYRRVRTIAVLGQADEVALGPRIDPYVLDDALLDAVARAVPRFAHVTRCVLPVDAGAGLRATTAQDADGERCSGLTRVLEEFRERVQRGETLTAWAAVGWLDDLVRRTPPQGGASSLRHRIERLRATGHEVAELDALDVLRNGNTGFSDAERQSAARLLGGSGTDARTRLGLGPVDETLVAAAAAAAVTVWRMRAAHPAVSRAARELAAIVVQSCEQLVAAGESAAAG